MLDGFYKQLQGDGKASTIESAAAWEKSNEFVFSTAYSQRCAEK